MSPKSISVVVNGGAHVVPVHPSSPVAVQTIVQGAAPPVDVPPATPSARVDVNGVGVQGPPGAPGPPGPEGPAGPEGPEGPVGPPGTGLVISGSAPSAGGLPLTGNTPGDAWITEDTGHVWVWDGTQWVDAGELQGPPGPAGPEGPEGDAGPVGATGATGAQGPQGVPGVQGVPGATGPTGPTGATGAASTVPGPQGPTGPTGPAGATGATGPAGPAPAGTGYAHVTSSVLDPAVASIPQADVTNLVTDLAAKVVGPASATHNAIVLFNTTTGKLVKDSAVLMNSVQTKPILATDLPTHATRHQSGGADVVDVKLLGGYPGGTANFLRADGTFAAPPGGTIPGAHASTHSPGGGDTLVNNAWTDISNAFLADQDIRKNRPTLRLFEASAIGKGRLTSGGEGDIRTTANVRLDPTGFLLDDTALTGSDLNLNFNTLTYNTFTAGANPRTPLQALVVTGAGNTTIAGTLSVTGKITDASLSANVQLKPIAVTDLPAHASRHQPGGADAMAVDAAAATGSLRTLGTGATQAAPGNDSRFTAAPQLHATTHQPGGSDAMAVDAIAATGSLRTLGTGAQQAASGTDSRFTNARTPTAHATTHQPGGSDAMAVDAAAATGSLRTLGTGATQAAPGNDSRFTAAPQLHAPTHKSGGTDAIKLDELAAPTDVTTLNASTTAHGLLRKLSNVATQFLDGTGAWTAPTTVPSAHATTHQPGGSDAMAVDAVATTGSLRTLGATATSACAGNDARLTNSRTPTAHATTHQPGGGDAMAVDAVAATGSLRTLGTGSTQAAAGNDARFTDARTPTAHATTHKTGGADVIALDTLGAPTDVTTLNATTSAHGLLQKLPGGTTTYLRADGTFATPAAGVPGAHHATHEPGGGDALVNAAWTNVSNTFTKIQNVVNETTGDGTPTNYPRVTFSKTDRAVDARKFEIVATGNDLTLQAINDAGTSAFGALNLNRSGTVSINNDLNVTGAGGNVACKDQANTFTQNQSISKASPILKFIETAAPANQRVFSIRSNGADALQIVREDDAGSAATLIHIRRDGNTDFLGQLQLPVTNPGLKFGGGTSAYPALRYGAGPAIEVVTADTPASSWIPIRAANFVASSAGSTMPDLTVNGPASITSWLSVGGDVDIIGGSGTGYNTAPIEIRMSSYPRIGFHWPGVVASQIGMDSAGTIRTYDNPGTGYAAFTAAAIRSTTYFYELGRGEAIGYWTDFTPNFGGSFSSITTNYVSRYMLLGRTMFIHFYWSATAATGTPWCYFPGGVTASGYSATPYCLDAGYGMVQTVPNNNYMQFYTNVNGGVLTIAGHVMAGMVAIMIT